MTRPDTRRCDDLWAWSEYLSPSNPPWRWPLWFPELLYFCFWCNGVCCEYFCFLSVVLVSTPFSFLVGGSVYSCLWYCDSDDEHKVGILSPLNAVFWLIDDQFLLLQQCILKIKILQIMPRCDDGVIRVFVYFLSLELVADFLVSFSASKAVWRDVADFVYWRLWLWWLYVVKS